jgi:hypothetical protein
MSEEKKATTSVLSLKRLNKIHDTLKEYMDDTDVDEVIERICEIMKFDPNYAKGRYTPESGKRFVEWQKKRVQELGVTQGQYRRGIKNT